MRLDYLLEDRQRPTRAQIARKVRRNVEQWAAGDSYLIDPDTKGFDDFIDIACVDPDDLGCACAIASMALAKSFKAWGYPARVVRGQYGGREYDGDDHCWVVSGDEIYDITATQFGERTKVMIVGKQHRKRGQFVYGKTMRSYADFDEWDDQRPTKYSTSILKHGPKKEQT